MGGGGGGSIVTTLYHVDVYIFVPKVSIFTMSLAFLQI